MLIQIDGWYASGKSVLWALLDSHPDIFVSPIHEYSYAPFLNINNKDEFIVKKHITKLRQTLAKSEYYKLEKVMNEGKYLIYLSTDEIIEFPYKTDFYSIDRNFSKELLNMKKWTIESICLSLYKNIHIVHTNSNTKPIYYATMSHPESYLSYEKIPSLIPCMKSITVKRDVKNIVASRTNRKERPNDLNQAKAFRVPFEKILHTNEIEKILHYYSTIDKLSKLYPEKFMSVNLSDLIDNRYITMKKVASFLKIKFSDSLLTATREGIELKNDKLSFLEKENDTFDDLLTSDEINTVNWRYNFAKFHKKTFYPFSLVDIIKSIYKFFRYKQ